MLIGADYDKIEFQLLGLELLEPTAFVGDMIMAFFGFLFAYKVSKLGQTVFIKNWKIFFFLFGLLFLFGGFGHLMYNYWAIPGKYAGWFLGIVIVFYVEAAMLSFIKSDKLRNALLIACKIKLLLALIGEVLIISLIDLSVDFSVAMQIPTVNSTFGLTSALVILSYYYSRILTPVFKFFILSGLVMLPAVFFRAMKINPAPWFDKNDVSHLVLFFGLILYYTGVKRVAAYQKKLS